FAFAPGGGGAQRSAIAVAEAGGCFSVGSYAARVSLGQDTFLLGPLLQILGVGADIDVLDLEGLADANIQALGLLDTDLGVATFDELVNTSVNLADFYLAVATVLERESGHTAEVDLLNSLAQLNLPDLDLTLGQILDLDTAGSSALGATLNVLDLVAASAFAANGQNVLSVPALDINVPGVTQLTAGLTIGQQPIISCGRVGKARAASSQVTLELSGHLTDLDLGLVKVSSPITVKVDLAAAEGLLQKVTCAPRKKTLEILASNGLLDLLIDLELDAILDFGLFQIPLVDAPLSFTTTRSQPAQTITLEVDDEQYTASVSTGDGSLGVPNLHVDTSGLTVLGIPLGTVTDWIVSPLLSMVLNPLVQALDATLLSPLLEALGVNVAGADYKAVPKADCGIPVLRG
ncbi:MAG: hypothetical protein WCS84_17790, partial [Nocardioides sp.]